MEICLLCTETVDLYSNMSTFALKQLICMEICLPLHWNSWFCIVICLPLHWNSWFVWKYVYLCTETVGLYSDMSTFALKQLVCQEIETLDNTSRCLRPIPTLRPCRSHYLALRPSIQWMDKLTGALVSHLNKHTYYCVFLNQRTVLLQFDWKRNRKTVTVWFSCVNTKFKKNVNER